MRWRGERVGRKVIQLQVVVIASDCFMLMLDQKRLGGGRRPDGIASLDRWVGPLTHLERRTRKRA